MSREEETFPAHLVTESLRQAAPGVPDHERKSVEPCPHCGLSMNPMNFNYSSGVVLDVCPSGHGMWFDKGEIEKVQIHAEHWNKELDSNRVEWARLVEEAKRETGIQQVATERRVESHLGVISTFFHRISSRIRR